MAEVKKDVERVVTEKVSYSLTLSPEEAQALAIITARVGGSEYDSPRKHTQAVFEALEEAGVPWYETAMSRKFSGHVTAVA